MHKPDLKKTIGLIAGAGAALALAPQAIAADNPFGLDQPGGATIVVDELDGRLIGPVNEKRGGRVVLPPEVVEDQLEPDPVAGAGD